MSLPPPLHPPPAAAAPQVLCSCAGCGLQLALRHVQPRLRTAAGCSPGCATAAGCSPGCAMAAPRLRQGCGLQQGLRHGCTVMAAPAQLYERLASLRLTQKVCLATIESIQRHNTRPIGCGATKCAYRLATPLAAGAPPQDVIVKFPNPDDKYWREHASTMDWQAFNSREIVARLLNGTWATTLLGLCLDATSNITLQAWDLDRSQWLRSGRCGHCRSQHVPLQHPSHFLLRHVPFWLEKPLWPPEVKPNCTLTAARRSLDAIVDEMNAIMASSSRTRSLMVVDVDHTHLRLANDCHYRFIDLDFSCIVGNATEQSYMNASVLAASDPRLGTLADQRRWRLLGFCTPAKTSKVLRTLQQYRQKLWNHTRARARYAAQNTIWTELATA